MIVCIKRLHCVASKDISSPTHHVYAKIQPYLERSAAAVQSKPGGETQRQRIARRRIGVPYRIAKINSYYTTKIKLETFEVSTSFSFILVV